MILDYLRETVSSLGGLSEGGRRVGIRGGDVTMAAEVIMPLLALTMEERVTSHR